MPEISYLLPQELRLLRIEIRAVFSEPLKHFPQVEQVLLEHSANHDHIVQVYET
jgi:hypothetical protein